MISRAPEHHAVDMRKVRGDLRVIGETEWLRGQITYTDYWEAVIWAMVLFERWALATDVRGVPVSGETRLSSFKGEPF